MFVCFFVLSVVEEPVRKTEKKEGIDDGQYNVRTSIHTRALWLLRPFDPLASASASAKQDRDRQTDRPMMMDCSQFHCCDVMHVHRVRIAIGSAAPPLSMQSKIGSRARPMLPSSASLDPLGIGALKVRPPSGFWFRFRGASRPTSSLVRSFIRSFVPSFVRAPFRFDSIRGGWWRRDDGLERSFGRL